MQYAKSLTYEYVNGILSIPAKLLYEEWKLIKRNTYQSYVRRGKFVRVKEGKGKGNTAYISYYDLPDMYKDICIEKLGDPRKVKTHNILENYIMPDAKAATFFEEHRKPDGKRLSPEKQQEKIDSCLVLNAIKMLLKDKGTAFGRQKTKIWQNISKAVNQLDQNRYRFNLPGAWRRLKEKYEAYLEIGYPLFIHRSEGNQHAVKIKGDIADFILATYCLPNKPSIPELIDLYDEERQLHNDWGTLTEQAVSKWLGETERRRIWVLARHGTEAWEKEFKHTLKRKRTNWFPNSYWAIDGTKLDWIHIWEESTNKLGAQLKIDVMFDVYSEKIIGYSLSFTENHTDHFKAVKMAVLEAQCRPYLISYDHQSGHKSKRMQELYSSLVAKKGTHYMHRSKAHNSPAEQLFNRIQQQVINKFWFSDGQSITVRKDDNKHNPDFIKEHQHLIKTTTELETAWKAAVYKWNTNKHPHFKKSRNEVYAEKMPMREKLDLLDIADKMWIKETRPITYRAHGLDMFIADNKYQYEVYDVEGNIDLEFRRKNIGKKFMVRYDPALLDSFVQLWTMNFDAEWVFVAHAQPKREHEVVPVLMQDGDKAQWYKDYKVRDLEFERDMNDYKKLMERTGITPEKLIENQEYYIKTMKDRPKKERSKLEAEENVFSRL